MTLSTDMCSDRHLLARNTRIHSREILYEKNKTALTLPHGLYYLWQIQHV